MNISFQAGFPRDLTDIAYSEYCAELARHSFLDGMSREEFARFVSANGKGTECALAFDKGRVRGFMLYSCRENGGSMSVSVPAWGHGAEFEQADRITARLFEAVAERTVRNGATDFNIGIYAGDAPVQRLFSFMQFGIISERTVRRITPIPGVSETETNDAINIREMSKRELTSRWPEVWSLMQGLLGQLKKSPVFYPCTEFTEEVYSGFFKDPATALYAAYEGERLVGIIESNREDYPLAFGKTPAANVGEAYVLPEYRGTGLAQGLLAFAEHELLLKNIGFDWVEHGTANPTARGFWNKYFDTFEYQFIRSVTI